MPSSFVSQDECMLEELMKYLHVAELSRVEIVTTQERPGPFCPLSIWTLKSSCESWNSVTE